MEPTKKKKVAEIRIRIVERDKSVYRIQYIEKGLLLWAACLHEDLWKQYIVPRKLHITGDGEVYEMEEFFNECDMIAQELAKKWLIKKKSKQNFPSKK
jgi:hypothetical protein